MGKFDKRVEHLNKGHLVLRDEKHDAYYCKQCNVWLEEQCEDEMECDFCLGRPETPEEK